MKAGFLFTPLLLFFLLGLASACAKKQPQEQRSNLASLDVSTDSFDFATVSGALDQFDGDPCATLEKLKQPFPDSTSFLFFNYLENGGNPEGRVSPLHSPILSLALNKNAKVPSPQEAFEIAKENFENGGKSIGDEITWAGAQCLYHTGIEPIPDFDSFLCDVAGFFGLDKDSAKEQFEQQIFDQVNEEIEKNFPGIFGGNFEVRDSLYNSIVRRSTERFSANRRNIEGLNQSSKLILQSPYRMPLLAALTGLNSDPSIELNTDKDEISKAILSGYYQSRNSNDESVQQSRICSMTLAYQQFSQLIKIQGFERPRFEDENLGDSSAKLKKFDKDNQELQTVNEFGFFVDSNNKPLILNQDILKNYQVDDPVYAVNSAGKKLSLSESIEWLKSTLSTYTLTSPSEPWVSEADQYLLGDITDPASLAILPSEFHALSLGLLTILLKNFSEFYLQEINSAGKLKTDDELAAGIVLISPTENEQSQFTLTNVLDLIHIAIDGSIAFSRLNQLPLEELSSRQPVYDQSVVERLADENNKDSGLYKLKKLHLGLAILALNFTDQEGGCFQSLRWNTSTGENEKMGECSSQLRSYFKSTLKKLGQRTKSKILVERSDQL